MGKVPGGEIVKRTTESGETYYPAVCGVCAAEIVGGTALVVHYWTHHRELVGTIAWGPLGTERLKRPVTYDEREVLAARARGEL